MSSAYDNDRQGEWGSPPSGEWMGFFLQPDGLRLHWMTFYLEFRGNELRGEGHDWVGSFVLRGSYAPATADARWIKQYLGQHQVLYAGRYDDSGIRGTWRIAGDWSDLFHIWPKDRTDLEADYLAAEQSPHFDPRALLGSRD